MTLSNRIRAAALRVRLFFAHYKVARRYVGRLRAARIGLAFALLPLDNP